MAADPNEFLRQQKVTMSSLPNVQIHKDIPCIIYVSMYVCIGVSMYACIVYHNQKYLKFCDIKDRYKTTYKAKNVKENTLNTLLAILQKAWIE